MATVTHDPEVAVSPRDHKVLLYDDDRQYVRTIGESASAALVAGGSVVLVGNRSQLAAAEKWIELSSGGPAHSSRLGRYATIDTDTVADELVVAREPAQAFEAALSDACGQVDLASTVQLVGSLVIFGGLVGVLWDRGEHEVAASIEGLGNRLASERGASILCAFPAATVSSGERREVLETTHGAVVEVQASRLDPLRADARHGRARTPATAPACTRVFPGAVPACRAARHFVRDILESAQSNDEVIDTMELICSELSANAVRHARSAFTVALECSPTHVRIAVTDDMPPAPDEDDRFPVRTGHGLGIVAALARDWGVELDGRGHAVWAEVADGAEGTAGPGRLAHGTDPASPHYGQSHTGS